MCYAGRQSRRPQHYEQAHTVQEQGPRIIVGGHALKKCECVADSIRRCRGKLRGIEKRVDRYYLLQQRRHNT